MCPAPGTSPFIPSKDIKIGKYTIRADTELIVHINGLNYNTSQWQRPTEFLPERFDPESPLYLTPDGKKRHSHAYTPFAGGKRVCFGKTFAELTIKMISLYLTHYFNFEHVDEKYRSKDCYPLAQFGMTGTKPPRMMTLTRF